MSVTVGTWLDAFDEIVKDDHPVYGAYGQQHLGYRELPSGKVLVLWPMTFGKVRLVVGPAEEPFVDDGWCYESQQLLPAVISLATWDGEGDPIDGWHRNIKTGRRRPEGDATKEYVHY